MIEVRDNTYLGLPVLTEREHEVVEDFAFGGNSRFDVGQVADLVTAKRPLIANVISFDIIHTINQLGEEDQLSQSEAAALEQGIIQGYRFMLGCMTYAFYLRSRRPDIPSFLDHSPRRSIILPVRKKSQYERVKTWLGGDAMYEYTDDDLDPLGEDIYAGCRDSAMYFRYSDHLNEIVDNKIMNLLEEKEASTDPDDDSQDPLGKLSDGFNQGAANCIEMYIQSYEQEQLNILGSLPPRGPEL